MDPLQVPHLIHGQISQSSQGWQIGQHQLVVRSLGFTANASPAPLPAKYTGAPKGILSSQLLAAAGAVTVNPLEFVGKILDYPGAILLAAVGIAVFVVGYSGGMLWESRKQWKKPENAPPPIAPPNVSAPQPPSTTPPPQPPQAPPSTTPPPQPPTKPQKPQDPSEIEDGSVVLPGQTRFMLHGLNLTPLRHHPRNPRYDGTGWIDGFRLELAGLGSISPDMRDRRLAQLQKKPTYVIFKPSDVLIGQPRGAAPVYHVELKVTDGKFSELLHQVDIEADNEEEFKKRAEKLVEVLKEIPMVAHLRIGALHIFQRTSMQAGYGEYADGLYSIYTREICVFEFDKKNTGMLRDIIDHEIAGHALILAGLVGQKELEWETRILLAIKAGGPEVERFLYEQLKSLYFRTNWRERFAESMVVFLRDPNVYWEKDPNMAILLEESLGRLPMQGGQKTTAFGIK